MHNNTQMSAIYGSTGAVGHSVVVLFWLLILFWFFICIFFFGFVLCLLRLLVLIFWFILLEIIKRNDTFKDLTFHFLLVLLPLPHFPLEVLLFLFKRFEQGG